MKIKNISNSPYVLLILAPLFWSGNFIVGRLIHENIPPLGLSFWRWLLASVIIFFIARAPLRRDWIRIKKNLPLLFLLSVLSVSTFNPLIYTGLKWTTSINAFLIQTVMPVLIVFMSFVFYREKILPIQTAGVLLSLIGALTIIIHGDLNALQSMSLHRGDVLIFIAVVCYAAYSVMLRKMPSIHPLSFAAVTFILGALTLLPPYIWETVYVRTMPLNLSSVMTVGYVAIFASVVAYLCFNRGVELAGANRAGMFIYLMPVFGSVMAITFLGERFEWFHFAGIFLIISGILLATRTKIKERM
ncbi:MAG: DMT family transporter [Smithellaceae bacterium]|jgi:drug/metabolite transporter (DMT)-like permease